MSPNQENSTRTLAGLAGQRLGVSPVTIYRYLSGTRYPALPLVRRIEEEFGWPIQDQVRLIPVSGFDMSYGVVLGEVMRENFPDAPAGAVPELALLPRGPRARGPRVQGKRGWTQASVAELLNTRASTVSRWLDGQRYPESRTMLRIEKLTGWPAAEQICLLPLDGYDQAYGAAFRAALDRTFPADKEV